MPQVERDILEKPTQLHQAELILNEFLTDYNTYPLDDFLLRRGICKSLEEEYHPLVRLAQTLLGVSSIQLLPKANPGPDAKITFWLRSAATVQITCAKEGANQAMERQQILDKGGVLLHLQWKRDKVTGGRVATGSGGIEMSDDVQARIDRILKAIAAKERKYYSDTEILLIHEAPANFEYLITGQLHERVCKAVLARSSHYQRIYVNYGEQIKEIK